MTEEEKKGKDLTLGERAVNWAKAVGIILPLVGTAVVSTLGYFKSDSAETGVDSLVKQLDKRVAKQEKVINVQSEQLEKMARRMIFFQAHQEGRTSGKMQAKIDQLEDDLAALKAKKITRTVASKQLQQLLRKAPRASKPEPAPPPVKADQVQSIPRLKPRPFSKKAE